MRILPNPLLINLILSIAALSVHAQDMNSLLSEEKPPKEFVMATFKGTRLINMHTIETPGKNTLEYRISHRFGTVNSGIENFYGLDGGATIRIGLEYSYNGRLEAGLGRSNTEKTVDGYLKYRILRQTSGKGNPVSITAVSSIFVATQKDPTKDATGIDRYQFFSNRLAFSNQLLIARKFNRKLSLQFSPMMIHYNLVDSASNSNDLFVLGFVGRYKLTNRLALTAEYAYRLNTNYTNTTYYNALGIGIDIETGGHVFQIHLTNASGMVEPHYAGFTNTQWAGGGIRIGFNISRVFTL